MEPQRPTAPPACWIHIACVGFSLAKPAGTHIMQAAATNVLLAHVKQEDLQADALDFLPSSPFLLPKQDPGQIPSLAAAPQYEMSQVGMGLSSMDSQFLLSVAHQVDRDIAAAEAGILPRIEDDGSLTDEECEQMIDPTLLPQGQLDDSDYNKLLLGVGRRARPEVVPNSHNKDNGARATRRKIVSASQITPREDGGRDYCCDVYGCAKQFRDRSGLRKHCDAKHSFICPHGDCTYVLNSMDAFLKHMHEHNHIQDQQENQQKASNTNSRRTRRKRSDSSSSSSSSTPKKRKKKCTPDEKASTDGDYLQCDFGIEGNPCPEGNGSDSSPTSVARSVYDDFPCLDLA